MIFDFLIPLVTRLYITVMPRLDQPLILQEFQRFQNVILVDLILSGVNNKYFQWRAHIGSFSGWESKSIRNGLKMNRNPLFPPSSRLWWVKIPRSLRPLPPL